MRMFCKETLTEVYEDVLHRTLKEFYEAVLHRNTFLSQTLTCTGCLQTIFGELVSELFKEMIGKLFL